MTNYTSIMKQETNERFSRLFDGVSNLVFTDFPDYQNIGDSAIAMGQYEFWEGSGIHIEKTYSGPILPSSVYESTNPVVIQGGGNFGGLYAPMSEHRYRLAERLRPDTLLIQAPQSIHFVGKYDRQQFLERMATRSGMRIGVRDHYSYQQVSNDVENVHLVPDAVHLLGDIPCPNPTLPYVVLAREDKETNSSGPVPGSFDWPADRFSDLCRIQAGWKSKYLPIAKPLLGRRNSFWQALASRRLAKGVDLLASGQTIVTDRLHAMLIGLQMGRDIIAIDNNNNKLRNYADTWFQDSKPNVVFVDNFSDGINAAQTK